MIVSVLSPKGGCGKSTATLTLATVFADNSDLDIAIVDADPRQSIARVWMDKRNAAGLDAPPFAVLSDFNDATILDTLEKARDTYDLTFVDLEGVAGLMASYAAAAADACIIPMRPSALDGDAAGAALKMIGDTGRTSRRTIPTRVLLTQTEAALISVSYREIIQELDEGSVPRFKTELIRRAAFERMMAEGKTLFELDRTKAVLGAVSNAALVGQELAAILEEE